MKTSLGERHEPENVDINLPLPPAPSSKAGFGVADLVFKAQEEQSSPYWKLIRSSIQSRASLHHHSTISLTKWDDLAMTPLLGYDQTRSKLLTIFPCTSMQELCWCQEFLYMHPHLDLETDLHRQNGTFVRCPVHADNGDSVSIPPLHDAG